MKTNKTTLTQLFTKYPYHLIARNLEFNTPSKLSIFDMDDFITMTEEPILGQRLYDFSYEGSMLIAYKSASDLYNDLLDIAYNLDLNAGGDDQYFDYTPEAMEVILYGMALLKHQAPNIDLTELKDVIIQKLKEYNVLRHQESILLYISLRDNLSSLDNYNEDLYLMIQRYIK